MKKFIQHGIYFIIAFCLFQVVCNNLLFNKIGKPYYHNKHFTTQFEQYLATKENFNTVFIGSSRVYRQINPQIIDKELAAYGIKSYNLGAPATFMPETFYLLDEYLENKPDDQQVQYVFMELTGITNIKLINWVAPQSYYYLNPDVLQLASKAWFGNPDLHWTKAAMNVYPFLQGYVIKQILPQGLPEARLMPPGYTGEMKNGFFPLEDELEQYPHKGIVSRREKFLADTSVLLKRKETQDKWKQENVDETLGDYLNQLVVKAEKKNVKLYFILLPKIKNYVSLAPLEAVIKDERVINVGNPEEHPELNFVENNFDHGHFNQKGATMFSIMLSDKIKERLERNTPGVHMTSE